MPEVEIRLSSVIGDEHLTVLVRAHSAGVDVEVRVELLERDAQVAGLQDVPDGRRSDALSQRGDDTPGHENVLGHRDLQGGFRNVTGLGGDLNVSSYLGSTFGSRTTTFVSYSPEDACTE